MITSSVDQDLARVNQDLPERHHHDGNSRVRPEATGFTIIRALTRLSQV